MCVFALCDQYSAVCLSGLQTLNENVYNRHIILANITLSIPAINTWVSVYWSGGCVIDEWVQQKPASESMAV